jgi:hypothetical protein
MRVSLRIDNAICGACYMGRSIFYIKYLFEKSLVVIKYNLEHQRKANNVSLKKKCCVENVKTFSSLHEKDWVDIIIRR